jgi:hypothetical protein
MTVVAWVAGLLRPLLDTRLVRRTRRNHALEHATIHMLNRQRYRLSGRSWDSGFVIYGEVPTEKVEAALQEALGRMRQGEAKWAIHPNCGTNLVTTGILTTLVAAFGFTGTDRRSAWERFPLVAAVMTGALLFSQPLGLDIQRHITTDGDLGDLDVVSVTRREMRMPLNGRKTSVHHVMTRNG